ncbi:MAG: RNA polymerase sporulation sigma factor SigH [Lachnospiraceae bacterium]|uniref:RNA polymerase sporulation sigma factor SigH n=1 Tax=Roseburia hominis TaxID=301301 RepID=UPI001F32FEC7|nr:RNA polymerase sporulation sigma factor SigH [Roseburia hominis]MCI5713153.1 RNA polymerase sporulation sigma factor SigH [Lachnospiraceae bacterium]MDD6169835.1 RNA polymerase sporulation sigma factor SigH [Lachnospiraceae bacterium]MDY4838295.1 RNA polymerase sporulation sigma factor SigH [Lachnospiraceae bacterium]
MQESLGNTVIYENYSDEELIFALREKNETEIMDYLLNKYKNLVKKKAKVLFLIGGDTDDLIQEGMIGLFKAIRDYDKEKDSSFFHFAQICISRQMYTAMEASNRKKHAPLNSYISLSASEENESGENLPELLEELSGTNPEQIVINKEELEQMRKKADSVLSPMEKEVLAYYLQGMNYTKIAEVMQKSAKSIDNALQRIRNKLKNA